MDKDTRNAIERATQRARKLLEEDFGAQLEGDFDVHREGEVAATAGKHLSVRQAFSRERIVAAIEHKRAAGMTPPDAARDYLRDAAFTTLNRFVALKMLEARELVQECITKGEQSAGYREFCGMAPGLLLLPDSAGYRLYIESLFDELSTEVKVLFERRDPSSVLWPKRATFEQLLDVLNATELVGVWSEDETIGWVYQFFNGQDERRKMREESPAPRNSRELAVRNQFFTPRYVVQFLTDNTLGRIWYDMRGTKTALAEKCEYMVRKPGEEFAPRAKKDPRDLRVLDPACGSGHFLLYAFDLLLVIYEEAYADPGSPRSEVSGKTLAQDYPSPDALRQAVPGLVLAHNLHGVDIDPRCAQIAQLALWMRAQKSYRDFGIGRAERAQIRRSNIVVAEPLVADEQIAKEFVAKLGDIELGRVFTSLVESLSLAGDLGLLLRVEQLVARQAKRGQTGDLFAPSEERIRATLNRFVREDAGTTNTRRWLFADDAAQGVGLLGVAEKKFDVVLMNPPFGAPSAVGKQAYERSYPRSWVDVYAGFVDRGVELLHPRGRLGALTSRTGLFLSSFERWRKELLLGAAPIRLCADLGANVLDGAMVEVVAYAVERQEASETDVATFVRLLNDGEKELALRESVASGHSADARVFNVKLGDFSAIPTSPLAYWAPTPVLSALRRLPALAGAGRLARMTNPTTDDFRFARAWWEVAGDKLGTQWRSWNKGGGYSPFYRDIDLVIDWDGRHSTYRGYVGTVYRPESRPANLEYFFRPGLTWVYRGHRLCVQAMPSGTIISTRGNGLYAEPGLLEFDLGLLNSTIADVFIKLTLGREGHPQFDIGDVNGIPAPPAKAEISRLAREGWSLMRALDSSDESSHAYIGPHMQDAPRMSADLARVQASLDEACLAAYFPDERERHAVEHQMRLPGSNAEEQENPDGVESAQPESADANVVGRTNSWLVGVAFGRFDPRIATGERAIPPEPDPFDPLPCRSPGMYPTGDEPIDRPDILVDDEGHPDDIAARAIAIAERLKVDAPDNLRAWLAEEFFPLHIKMYSKSRRKAPIYWQLATPSAGYSVWLYIHPFSKDTLFRVQNDYVAPKLAHEERRLESLTSELRDSATAAQRKTLAARAALVEELRALLDEVKRVAPLWNPNLDDGVIINFAPLWRLVPQNKSWQKELKSTWDALCEGKYDWAHLAMHFWPERVVPKCAKDRSLAIAHGLEDVFWVEGTDGKWMARKTPTRSVDVFVKERTSPAVKSALKSLLEAPVVSGKSTGRKGGGRRKAAAVTEGDA